MRTKSVDEVLDAQNHAPELNLNNLFLNFLPWSPLIEPEGEIPEQPLNALMSGNIDQVPLMAGSVFDEGQLFVYELFTSNLTQQAYEASMLAIFGAKHYPRIIRMYPFDIVENATDGRQALNVLGTDLLFYCPLRNVTRGYQQTLGVKAMPTWIYAFEHIISFDCWGPDYWFCVGYVCHGSELPFVFNVFTDGETVSYDPTPDELQLTVDLSNTWSNFIARGDPNRGLTIPVKFPAYVGVQDEILILNEPGTETVQRRRDLYCNMWDELGYFW